MNCPACGKVMIEKNFGSVMVDVCENGCKGMWFDWFELDKLNEDTEGFGSALDEALVQPRKEDQDRGKINCPKCHQPMYLHKHKTAKEVDVDECVNCGGFFLDAGELGVIRDNVMNPKEAEKYINRLLAEVPGYAERKSDLEDKKARQARRNRGVRRWGRFLRGRY